MEQSLRLYSRLLPPDDPELTRVLGDALGLVESAPDATLSRKLLDAWAGAPMPRVQTLRQDLSLIAVPDRGTVATPMRTGRAEALSRLLNVQRGLLGADDPALVRTLTTQMRAAECEAMPGLKAEAAIEATRVLSRKFGANDPTLLVCVQEAAVTLAITGDPERAIEFSRRACDIRDRVPVRARDPLLDADSRRYLALCLTLAGHHEEAIPVWEAAIEELRAAVGPEHHAVAVVEGGLAMSLLSTGQVEQADEMSAKALALAERLSTPSPDQMATHEFVRGHVLVARRKWAEARPLLERAWDPVYQSLSPRFHWRVQLLRDLVEATQELGEEEQSREWERVLRSAH